MIIVHQKHNLFDLHGFDCNVPSLDNTAFSNFKGEYSIVFMCSVKDFTGISKCAFIVYWSEKK